jgi:hypothetical protein
MSRIVKYFAIAGGAIPVLLLLITSIELAINIKKVPYATTYGLYLWPSSVMLIGGAETLTPGMALRLGVAIITNVLLYTILGLFITGIAKLWQSVVRVREQ